MHNVLLAFRYVDIVVRVPPAASGCTAGEAATPALGPFRTRCFGPSSMKPAERSMPG
jgi:hypothetical protein